MRGKYDDAGVFNDDKTTIGMNDIITSPIISESHIIRI